MVTFLQYSFLPEIALFALALTALATATFTRREAVTFALCQYGLLVIALVIVWQMLNPERLTPAFVHFLLIDDSLAGFAKIILTLGTFFVCALSEKWLFHHQLYKAEFPILLLLALLGMYVMVSANNLLVMYVGLELQSLALYTLASFARNSRDSAEAGIKYFILGSLSSGLLLFGASLIYGVTGALDYAVILTAELDSPLAAAGIVFLLAGIAFKLSAAPFHMWTPDAYQGAPTPTTAFLAIVPKLAAFCLGIRLLLNALFAAVDVWQPLLMILAVASMLIGSLGALMQNNIKRLLAYSAISHAGFMLIGFAVASADAIEATLLYLLLYAIMTTGLFAFVLAMQRERVETLSIEDFRGLAQTHPASAFFLLLLLFSIAGIPPLAGFFAKFYVFIAAIEQGFYPLVIVGVATSCISAFYYIRLIGLMYFTNTANGLDPVPATARVTTAAAAAFAVTFVLFQSNIIVFARQATLSMFAG